MSNKPNKQELLNWLNELDSATVTNHTAAYNSFIIFHIKEVISAPPDAETKNG